MLYTLMPLLGCPGLGLGKWCLLQEGVLSLVTIISIQGPRARGVARQAGGQGLDGGACHSGERAQMAWARSAHRDMSLMPSILGSHGGRNGILAVMLRAWVI